MKLYEHIHAPQGVNPRLTDFNSGYQKQSWGLTYKHNENQNNCKS